MHSLEHSCLGSIPLKKATQRFVDFQIVRCSLQLQKTSESIREHISGS